MANLITEGFDWLPDWPTLDYDDAEAGRLLGANGWFAAESGADGRAVPRVGPGAFDFGKALQFDIDSTSVSSYNVHWVVPFQTDHKTEVYFGVRMFIDSSNGQYANPIFGVIDAVNGIYKACFTFERHGVIRFWNQMPDYDQFDNVPGPGILAASQSGVFQEEEWFFFEARVVIDSTNGIVEGRVNTKTVLDLVDVDTDYGGGESGVDAYVTGMMMGSSQTMNACIDDIYVNDTTGATCNGFLGNVRTKTQFMIGAGDSTDFSIGGTVPAPTNWQSVGNRDLDEKKYVYSPTVGDYDLYDPDPNLNAPLVHVVQLRSGARMDDSTQRILRHRIKIGATEYTNAQLNYLNQSYTFYKSRWEINPATSVTFTGAEVNALQVGNVVE